MIEQLTRIKIEGFRSLKSLDLELGAVNILIGANGAGKSNFVGFFTMLSYALSGSLQLYVGRKGGAQSILHYGSKRTPILRAELQFQGPQNRSEYRLSLAHSAGDRLIYTYEEVRFQKHGHPRPFVDSLGAGHKESELLPLSNSRAPGQKQTVARIFVNRLKALQAYHFHDTSDDSNLRNTQDLNRNETLLSTGGNLAAFLYAMQQTRPQHFDLIVQAFQLDSLPFQQTPGHRLHPVPALPGRIPPRPGDRGRTQRKPLRLRRVDGRFPTRRTVELTILCEGPTESNFITSVLRPHLVVHRVFARAIPLRTARKPRWRLAASRQNLADNSR